MSKKELPRGVPEAQTPIPGGAEDKQAPMPKFGTERPVEDVGPLPRVCHPLDRVDRKTGNVCRFKVQAKNYQPQPVLYVLARTEDSARDCYLKESALAAQLDRLKKTAGPDGKVEAPDLVVTELPD